MNELKYCLSDVTMRGSAKRRAKGPDPIPESKEMLRHATLADLGSDVQFINFMDLPRFMPYLDVPHLK